MILRREKCYYKNDEERLREQAWNKYRELPVEEKNAKQNFEEVGTIMSEEKKNKIKKISKKLLRG